MQVVVEPLPRLHLRHAESRSTVSERRKEEETPDQSCDNDARGGPCSQERLASHALPNGLVAGLLCGDLATILRGIGDIGRLEVEDELDQRTGYESTGEMRREVVMQKELTAHDEERNVVGGPSQEEEAGAVIQARAGT